MNRRERVIAMGLCLAAAIAVAAPVLADDWMEANSHHTITGQYHVHAYVKAWAYSGGGDGCHYNQWTHTQGDTTLYQSYYTSRMTYSSDAESPWTTTIIEYNGEDWDQSTATLPNLQECPA